mmetsp:Transcript_15036/g.36739  ORF Transcript_15036/g.36739 Transcript_15036/m.36739 type:complete len:203 (-) Transcript_15036:393-1001(-)
MFHHQTNFLPIVLIVQKECQHFRRDFVQSSGINLTLIIRLAGNLFHFVFDQFLGAVIPRLQRSLAVEQLKETFSQNGMLVILKEFAFEGHSCHESTHFGRCYWMSPDSGQILGCQLFILGNENFFIGFRDGLDWLGLERRCSCFTTFFTFVQVLLVKGQVPSKGPPISERVGINEFIIFVVIIIIEIFIIIIVHGVSQTGKL